MDNLIDVWITKYVFTDGIQARRASTDTVNKKLIILERAPGTMTTFFWKPYWHTSYEEAVKHARLLIHKKRASLEKQLDKLRLLRESLSDPGETP